MKHGEKLCLAQMQDIHEQHVYHISSFLPYYTQDYNDLEALNKFHVINLLQ